MGTAEFTRIRVGIGKPKEHMGMIAHVIGAISDEEKELLEAGMKKAEEAVVEIIKKRYRFSNEQI